MNWQRFGFVLDLRSKDYQQCAPLPAGAGVELIVATEGPEGRTQALNHFNKAAKGHLVRTLAESMARSDATVSSAFELCAWGEMVGLDFRMSRPESSAIETVTLVTSLGAPAAR